MAPRAQHAAMKERLERKVARLLGDDWHAVDMDDEDVKRLTHKDKGLDIQDYLGLALLPPKSVLRKKVTEALRRAEKMKRHAESQRRSMREEEMVPLHVAIGKGATMTLWTEKKNRD